MEKQIFEKLAGIMGRIAGGDREAVFELYTEFGGHLAGLMRRHLRRLGIYDIDPRELDGLVMDGCLMLRDVAGAWDPVGGALPWNWAGHRVVAIVSGWVGQHAVEFDPARHEQVVIEQLRFADQELEELEVLSGLRHVNPGCALLFEALERVASTRDRALLLEMRCQDAAGDPSPAVTVAARHGMRPDAVRQAACRVRSRLRLLAATEGHFAPLEDMAILA